MFARPGAGFEVYFFFFIFTVALHLLEVQQPAVRSTFPRVISGYQYVEGVDLGRKLNKIESTTKITDTQSDPISTKCDKKTKTLACKHSGIAGIPSDAVSVRVRKFDAFVTGQDG